VIAGGGGSYAGAESGGGGDGVIIIGYPDAFKAATVAGTVSSASSGNTRVYIFTGSGTISF
jgi:hypothetical protein